MEHDRTRSSAASPASPRQRLRRMMRLWGWLAAALSAAALAWLWDGLSWGLVHYYVGTVLLVAGTTLMTGALMSLAFLSAGSGHDAAVHQFEPDDRGDRRQR